MSFELRRGGRQRRIEERAAEVQAGLRSEQLAAPGAISEAMGATVGTLVAEVGDSTPRSLGSRPPSPTVLSSSRTPRSSAPCQDGMVLGARVLGEFGDDPNRYADSKSRKKYAGTSPITKASGTRRVVLARYAPNRRLADACYLLAFASLTASPAPAPTTTKDATPETHTAALCAPRQPLRRHPPRLPASRCPLRRTDHLGASGAEAA